MEEAADDGEEASTAESMSELCTPALDDQEPKVTSAKDKKLSMLASQMLSALKQAKSVESKPADEQSKDTQMVEQPEDIQVVEQPIEGTQGDRASVIAEELKLAFQKVKKSNALAEKDGGPKTLPLHVPSLKWSRCFQFWRDLSYTNQT